MHHPYSTADILRRNVADLEIALRKQTKRAEKAEAELKELREQVPLTFVHDPNGYAIGGTHTEIADALPVGTDLYASPIPAPAVPDDWREVMAELAADLQASIEAEHAYRDQYSSVMRKYQNDMRIVERARSCCNPPEKTMIDDKTLAEYEARSLELGCTGNAEILRLARRYLALRESGVYLDASYEYAFNGDDLDAAADRLLEGGE